ncbi:MAG: ester cyclase [Caldilineaceae bacterium]
MMLESNKALICQFIDIVINQGRLDQIDHFVDAAIVDHNAGADQAAGSAGYRQHLLGVRTTFPDFTLTVDAQFAEGDYVITRVTGRGTHQQAWLGITPRGTPVTVTGINIDRVVNHKIVEHWGEADTVGMLLQLGVTLTPLV